MSHILLKQVPSSSITTPTSTDIKIFSNINDNGVLYYVDNSGNKLPVGSGLYTSFISTTYNDLYNLYTSGQGQFATGSYYLITDFYTVYEQPTFYFDGTLISQGVTKTTPVSPLLVQAATYNTLSPYATQPGFPKDRIKYDISWNKTEFYNNAKGRITERIDEFNNRTDYDHRTIMFRRYQNYERDTQLTGTITDWNCVTGNVTGASTSFNTELLPGDIIIIDSKSDIGYDIGLRVVSVTNATMSVKVDSLYTGGVPSTVPLSNGSSQIVPIDYSFSAKNYNAWKTYASGNFDSHKEVYFGQSDDNDYVQNYTFSPGSYNNTLSNFSKYYLSLNNNFLILSNNVFFGSANNNLISGDFYYNTITSTCTSNVISGKMYGNVIGVLRNNQISGDFYSNINFSEISYNNFAYSFANNIGDGASASEFRMNRISCPIAGQDFTSSTHVYNAYNCDIFLNNNLVPRLSYYDLFDILNITNVNA